VKRLLLIGLALSALNAGAQTYPSRPITLVVPYTPGTRDIVDKWNKELASILALPDVRDTFTKQGMVPAHSNPEEIQKQIAADVARWEKFIAETGIKAD
jgi:tripartite-type tricarboxylate transporter receptor subunit TctC